MDIGEALLRHYEAYLGPVWSRYASKGPATCQYLRFDGAPTEGASTVVTMGLSQHLLCLEVQ
jgi:hypothetical protein